MKFEAKAISEEEAKRIHEDSLRVLEEVGVKVPSEQVLSMLEGAGAKVDWDTQVALIDRCMVEKALKTAPREFTLGGRNPEADLLMKPGGCMAGGMKGPFINMDGCGSHVIDLETGERRLGLLKDLSDAGRIFDAIPEAQILWSSIMPDDCPADAAGVVSSAVSMLSCGKHLMDEVQNVHEWPFILELAKAFVGTEEAVRERKIYGGTYCTVAPLTHDPEMLEGTILLAKYMGPVLAYPMPCNGTTGPASLYGNLVLSNAEITSKPWLPPVSMEIWFCQMRKYSVHM